MAGILNRRRVLRMVVPGGLLVLALLLTLVSVPPARATGRVAAVTTTSISYRFEAQLTTGAHVGAALHGWLSGTQDSTGVLTATLTTDVLPRLSAGCAPHTDFAAACVLPPTANVSGHVSGKGANATLALTARGKGWTWILGGSAVGATGRWAGTLTQGSTYAGPWTLTPIASTIHIDLGLKSAAKSKHKLAATGALDLNVTADGQVIGTYSPANGGLPSIVQGYANANKASITVAVPMGQNASILVTGWSRPGFNVLNWTGSFVGPATGDYGTWLGQG